MIWPTQVTAKSIAKDVRVGQHLSGCLLYTCPGNFQYKSAKKKGERNFKVGQNIQKQLAVLSAFQSNFFIVQPINKCLIRSSTVLGT